MKLFYEAVKYYSYIFLNVAKMNGEELFERFDEMVKKFSEIVGSERARFKADVAVNNPEMQQKEAVDMSDDDIINLNVGGTKLTTLRSTLCQVEDSLLTAMFSGRWEDNIKRDKDGAVFFDFNPQYFILILDYLRAKKIATPQNLPPLPSVPADQEESFNSLVQYLGLGKEITVPCDITRSLQSEKFSIYKRSHGISLEEGRKVAVCDDSEDAEYHYALGENTYSGGNVILNLNWKVTFRPIFVGITEGDVKLLSNNIKTLSTKKRNDSYKWPGSYGWFLGDNRLDGVWKDGSYESTQYSIRDMTRPQQQDGSYRIGASYEPRHDTAKLVLECEVGKVSLHFPTGQEFHIDIPKDRMWKLNVTLKSLNDRIRILEG